MKPIDAMEKKDLKDIKMVVFDVDGVLVPRGTRISQEESTTTLHTKTIGKEEILRIKKLYDLGYSINISSGRGLYMLQDMFRSILSYASLTFENGSATWDKGNIIQHFNSYEYLAPIYPILASIKDDRIKGFEPKEFIITIHCRERLVMIEDIVSRFPKLYTVWNGEAYDIGVNGLQTKGVGLSEFMKVQGLIRSQVIAIGDNLNDIELLDCSGMSVTADRTRVKGDFYIDMGERMPASVLMDKIIELSID